MGEQKPLKMKKKKLDNKHKKHKLKKINCKLRKNKKC